MKYILRRLYNDEKETVKEVLDELMQLDIISAGEALRMYQDYTQRGKN